MASAAGLMSFCRTLSGAFATSIVTTVWDDKASIFRSDLVGKIDSPLNVARSLGDTSQAGLNLATYVLNQNVQSQAVMLATNQTFLIMSCVFIFAASAIWFSPKQTNRADTSNAH
jgi:DHA2 family multidrug resistance protein